VLVAEALRVARSDSNNSYAKAQHERDCTVIAGVLKSDNPYGFDYLLFMQNCGLRP
jgi:hypothetical protein